MGLTLWEGTNGFVVYCDALRVGLGCVLMQHGKVVAYAYTHLKVHEKNYATHNYKLAAVVFSLKIWRHYLYSVHVDMYTNHNCLQYVFTQKKLNVYQRRWLEFLKYYNMSVFYNPNKVEVVEDALSRITMDIMSHVEEGKRDLGKDVHSLSRLGVWLENSPNGYFVVHNNFKSSLVVEVKSKQHLDMLLI